MKMMRRKTEPQALPYQCYSVLPSSGELIMLRRGQQGYFPVVASMPSCSNRERADRLNREVGITKAQEAAMVAGSLFGFDAPAARPENYDMAGKPILKRKSTEKER